MSCLDTTTRSARTHAPNAYGSPPTPQYPGTYGGASCGGACLPSASRSVLGSDSHEALRNASELKSKLMEQAAVVRL